VDAFNHDPTAEEILQDAVKRVKDANEHLIGRIKFIDTHRDIYRMGRNEICRQVFGIMSKRDVYRKCEWSLKDKENL
jgi:hypothetical protein